MSSDETNAADGSTDTDDQQHPRNTCYFCGSSGDLETHHVFPQRYGGGEAPDNLVDLCDECHRKIERLYDDATFWGRLDLTAALDEPEWRPLDDPDVTEFEVLAHDGVTVTESASESPWFPCDSCWRRRLTHRRTHKPSGKPMYICGYCGHAHVLTDTVHVNTLKEVVAHLENDDCGSEIDAIVNASEEYLELTESEVENQLEDLYRRGEVYKPTEDTYRAVL